MELLTSAEVAELLRVKAPTVRAWRCRGEGPKYTRVSNGKRVLYRRSDVEAWWKRQEHRSRP
jgi:excisionase family DNA binding protein